MLDSIRHTHPIIGLVDEVSRLQGRLKGVFAQAEAGSGLSSMEMTVLSAVVEAKSSPTVPQIGRSLGHPRQVIQRAANTLAANGVITTTENPDHKKAFLLAATPKGLAIKRNADEAAATIAAALLENLDSQAVADAAVILQGIRQAIELHQKTAK